MKQTKPLKKWITRVLIYALLIGLAVTYIYPLFYMFINSIKTQTEYMIDPFSVDLVNGHYENYAQIFYNFHIHTYLGNTLLVTALKLLIIMPLSIIASYAFAKLRFRGQHVVYPAIMTAMYIPFQVIMIPVYIMLTKVQLIDSFFGLALVTAVIGIPSTIMLLTANFRAIPTELVEAGAIDGCGYFRTIWNIIIPMGKPAISICVIINFISSWNDLLAPMVIIKGVNKRLIMPALDNLVSVFSKDIPFQLAGMLIASLPAILIYIILQKQIIMGVSAGSTK